MTPAGASSPRRRTGWGPPVAPATLAAVLALSGCAAMGPSGPAPGTLSSTAHDGVAGTPALAHSRTRCAVETRYFGPERPPDRRPSQDLVVLAPGFLRDQSHLGDLARAIAAHGIPTVTLSPCASRPWAGRQVQDAADMTGIARQIGASRVVYGGFSAGALSALVAARLDRRSVGVLALDLVDNGGIGVGMARRLDVPLIGLHGDPSPCNAQGNGRPVFAAAPHGQLAAIPGASHCDFESPTDGICETLCGGAKPGAWRRRQEILGRSVDAVAGLLAEAKGTDREHGRPTTAAHPRPDSGL